MMQLAKKTRAVDYAIVSNCLLCAFSEVLEFHELLSDIISAITKIY